MRGLLLLLSALVAACAAENVEAPAPAPVTTAKRPVRTPGPMSGVHATRMGEALAEVGLDVRDLPPLETLSSKQRMRVMKTFTESLGVPCVGCHAEEGFTADTKRKRVAKRMYNELVRVLAIDDKERSPVFCDSCHDGTMFILDRREKRKVATYMAEVLVGKLRRVDGRDHDCGTCHEDGPDFRFVTTWKSMPAPEIDRSLPAARVPPDPASYTPTTKACGQDLHLCPLQFWMRERVAPSFAAGDAKDVAVAMDEVAKYSPDASWKWGDLAHGAAEAARRGDLVAARESCQECHVKYKAEWRASHRTRKP